MFILPLFLLARLLKLIPFVILPFYNDKLTAILKFLFCNDSEVTCLCQNSYISCNIYFYLQQPSTMNKGSSVKAPSVSSPKKSWL